MQALSAGVKKLVKPVTSPGVHLGGNSRCCTKYTHQPIRLLLVDCGAFLIGVLIPQETNIRINNSTITHEFKQAQIKQIMAADKLEI